MGFPEMYLKGCCPFLFHYIFQFKEQLFCLTEPCNWNQKEKAGFNTGFFFFLPSQISTLQWVSRLQER